MVQLGGEKNVHPPKDVRKTKAVESKPAVYRNRFPSVGRGTNKWWTQEVFGGAPERHVVGKHQEPGIYEKKDL